MLLPAPGQRGPSRGQGQGGGRARGGLGGERLGVTSTQGWSWEGELPLHRALWSLLVGTASSSGVPLPPGHSQQAKGSEKPNQNGAEGCSPCHRLHHQEVPAILFSKSSFGGFCAQSVRPVGGRRFLTAEALQSGRGWAQARTKFRPQTGGMFFTWRVSNSWILFPRDGGFSSAWGHRIKTGRLSQTIRHTGASWGGQRGGRALWEVQAVRQDGHKPGRVGQGPPVTSGEG